jgi:protein ImuB
VVKNPGTQVRADRLRPLAGPRLLRVEADERGQPSIIAYEGAPRTVTAIQDRWRIDDEWWRETPLSRTYYRLQLEGDRVVTVYQDLIGGEWWLQRY